ncbi:alpha-2,8-polysialyltransferase family protein [Streptomyces sp. WAC 00631]|uniref:polysialyltransferase family glycosyltransferase n=1 Tax=Streptomyces sp. WAC 00631 TaxID=2203201 RepID=UPI000F78BAE8|nr:polysialyltransferase family glycosyltransferase [Streptomyces sp. WAC 00631]MCC5033019.1 alpha-2,8-polysialyltransferase family protein [Streptomyces sp. WAC 00631]
MADGRQTTGPRTVQLFQVSTLYGAATLVAALEEGQFGPREDVRRVLLVSHNAAVPETAVRLTEMRGWDRLAARFDDIVDWNAAIRPHHPSTWSPAANDAEIWQRLFRHSWRLGDGPVELAVESVQVSPARALATIFAESTVDVYADGLMSYGPTRNPLPGPLARRIRRLLHPDLVPGLRPLLLSEYGVPAELVPTEALKKVIEEIGGPEAGAGTEPGPGSGEGAAAAVAGATAPGAPTAVLLGQYLAALDILTPAEEEALHERMLRGAAAAGHRSVLFKPHPTAPARYSRALEKAAAEAGVRLTVSGTPMLAEELFRSGELRLVVGCFSTAMFTAAVCYGVPVARVGTDLLLERIAPYENSNRVPLTITDHLIPEIGAFAGTAAETAAGTAAETTGAAAGPPGARPESWDVDGLTPLIRTVGFCMRPEAYPWLRAESAAWLEARLGEDTRRYFKRRRLTALDLPGKSEHSWPGRQLRRVARMSGVSRMAGAARSARGRRPRP